MTATEHQFKNQHYNPVVYLRQFRKPKTKNELWEFDVSSGTANQSTPKKSGCEDFYHSFTGSDGVRDDVTIEQSFHVIENHLQNLFEAIRNRQPLSIRAWSTFFLFADLQRSRCPGNLASTQSFLDAIYKLVFESWKNSPDFDDTVKKDGMNPDEVRAVKLESVAHRDDALMPLIKGFWSGNGARTLSRMKWVFLLAPSNKFFFTSDNPFCCWAPPDKRGPFDSVGTANASVEVTFPLSRSVCAFGGWQSLFPRLYNQVRGDTVDGINTRTVDSAWRFVYGPTTRDAKIISLVEQVAHAEKKLHP